uniref:Response regulator transcription factor n=1 Tax=Thermodesulfovibrio aggregans TaxID=86166 RepID=A0A7C4EM71_9BACT
MNRIFLIEKDSFVSNFLNKLIDEERISIIRFGTTDEALQNIEHQVPQLIVLNEDIEESDILNFCKTVRRKYTLLIPILVVVNFYSSLNLSQLKSIEVDFIVRPFTVDEIKKRIETILFKKKELSIQMSDEDFIMKFKPYIKEEVRAEMINILKQLLEDKK